MLNPRTREHISGLNDEALIEYVAVGVDLYELEAVEFARQELNRRNIEPELLAKRQVEVSLAVDDQLRAEIALEFRPLGRWDRALAFTFGWVALTPIWLVLWLRMYRRRQFQAARDLWRFGLLGWGFWMVEIGSLAVWSDDLKDSGLSGRVMILVGGIVFISVFIVHRVRVERPPKENEHAFEVMPPKR